MKPLLPHVFPFRFLDREADDESLRVRWTGNGTWSRGGSDLGLSLAVEMMAQAAVMEAPEESRGAQGYLAGISAAELVEPIPPGTVLTAETELLGRLGGLAKIRAELKREDGTRAACAELLLAIES